MWLNKKIVSIIIACIFIVPLYAYPMGNKTEAVSTDPAKTEISTPVPTKEIGEIDFNNLSNLVVEVETCKELKEKLIIYRQLTQELTTQVSLARQETAVYKEKFEAANAQIGINEQLYLKKEEVLKKELEEAEKPRYKAMLASASLGSVLTLVLLIAAGL